MKPTWNLFDLGVALGVDLTRRPLALVDGHRLDCPDGDLASKISPPEEQLNVKRETGRY